jgi:CubicO group peptidase (beta-lactamase class C family)
MSKFTIVTKYILRLSTICIITIFTLSNCSGNLSTPEQLNDGIQTANIKDYTSDTTKLEQLLERSEQGKLKKQDSLLIMKDGKLVLEKYYGDWSRYKLHNLKSVSKSVTALLVAEALEKKLIKSIDDPISNYLPEYKAHFTGGKEKITIKHLLNMTAGLAWNEDSFPYSDSINFANQEAANSNGGNFTLSQKLMYKPGTFFLLISKQVLLINF